MYCVDTLFCVFVKTSHKNNKGNVINAKWYRNLIYLDLLVLVQLSKHIPFGNYS